VRPAKDTLTIIQLRAIIAEVQADGSEGQGLIAMNYLTEQQRAALAHDLKQMSFKQANWKVKRMDPHGRLVFYRTAQRSRRWLTRYELAGLGTRVTLVEDHSVHAKLNSPLFDSDFELVDVIVEPTPDNRL